MNYEICQGDNMSKRLYIRYSVYDADTEECLIKDSYTSETIKEFIPKASVDVHYFNIMVSTLGRSMTHDANCNTNTR